MRSLKSCGGSTRVGGLQCRLSEWPEAVVGYRGKLCLVEGLGPCFWFGMAKILSAYLLALGAAVCLRCCLLSGAAENLGVFKFMCAQYLQYRKLNTLFSLVYQWKRTV